MRMDRNKVYLPLTGRPALALPLATLEASEDVSSIVVVSRVGDDMSLAEVLDLVRPGKVRATVHGGASRHASEQAGLDAVRALRAEGSRVDHILVHDGARPFLTLDLLDRLVRAARRCGGAIPTLALPGTVFAADGAVVRPVPSADLVTVQTPQVFLAEVLLHAFAAARADGFDGVDTAQVVEHYAGAGAPVVVAAVPGDPRNLKITTEADVAVARALAEVFVAGRWTDRSP
jgi:2-C-methyl-D-erythritol 4-phosphate cytidylyltransferase